MRAVVVMMVVVISVVALSVRVGMRMRVVAVRVCVGVPLPEGSVRMVRITVIVCVGVIVRVGVSMRVRVAVRLSSVLVAMLMHILSCCSLRTTTPHRHFLMPVDGADLDMGRGNVSLASHHLFHVQIPLLCQRQDGLEPRYELITWRAL